MTIYIDRGQNNDCIFTLTESTTLSLPKYFIQIVSKATNYDKLMWLNSDLSTNPVRYNKYIVEEVEPDDEDLEDQKVNLPSGSYNFFVWETDSDDLDIDQAENVVESGNLIVNGEAIAVPKYDGRNVKVTFKPQN